jgi:hypothetical protein
MKLLNYLFEDIPLPRIVCLGIAVLIIMLGLIK